VPQPTVERNKPRGHAQSRALASRLQGRVQDVSLTAVGRHCLGTCDIAEVVKMQWKFRSHPPGIRPNTSV